MHFLGKNTKRTLLKLQKVKTSIRQQASNLKQIGWQPNPCGIWLSNWHMVGLREYAKTLRYCSTGFGDALTCSNRLLNTISPFKFYHPPFKCQTRIVYLFIKLTFLVFCALFFIFCNGYCFY